MATTTLHVQCHCKSTTFSLDIPSSSFPLLSSFCSCSSCRHATGQLAASFATIPKRPDDLQLDVSNLLRYKTSEHRTRYSCSTCGASVLDFDKSDDRWRVCTGLLSQTEGLLERNQIYLADTTDGGLSIWLENAGKTFSFSPQSEAGEFRIERMEPRISSIKHPADARLRGSCHCRGVQFEITSSAEDKGYTAGLDFCSSCRLTSGFEITSWTSVPLDHVQMPDGSPLNLATDSITCYDSSPRVHRYSCRKCGAMAFVTKDNQSWVDIAVGLLRAEEGARAQSWLNWSEVGFLEEALDQQLVTGLRQGLKTGNST